MAGTALPKSSAWAGRIAWPLLAEQDRWFLWIPVAFASGIGAYFALYDEPDLSLAGAFVAGASGLFMMTRRDAVGSVLAAAVLCAALGFADAKLRVLFLSTPMLERATGVVTVHGWIEENTARLPSGRRLTLRVIEIDGLKDATQPGRVRITTRKDIAAATGSAIEVRARLRPLPQPVMPEGFDFARKGWFNGLGATGFSLGAPEAIESPSEAPLTIRWLGLVDHVRKGVESRIAAAVPGAQGAIITALITGERGRIPEPTLDALRHSGLAHLLAISGLHMALMAGALYWLARAAMAAVPALALRWPIKKIAAVIALAGGLFYLALSGASVATQRAFLMMGIVFLAVLLDRPALTLRNVALAAIGILAVFPESLLDVSFQMSFAATIALVAVYERWNRRPFADAPRTGRMRVLRASAQYLAGIALTTVVASVAVAPFAAFHFHKLAQYSLIANLVAMPVFGLTVMPMALAALLLMPLELEAAPLWIMSHGIDAVLWVAETVSGWSGAVIRVAAMPNLTLILLAFGGLWIGLWRGQWRYAGLVVAAVGVIAAGLREKPDVLVARDGGLVAVRSSNGAYSVPKVASNEYSLRRWLEADGDGRKLEAVRANEGLACDDVACVTKVKGSSLAVIRHPSAIGEDCAVADIVIGQIPVGRRCSQAKVVVDRMDVARYGAHAIYIGDRSIRVETVANRRGRRPWTRGKDQ